MFTEDNLLELNLQKLNWLKPLDQFDNAKFAEAKSTKATPAEAM